MSHLLKSRSRNSAFTLVELMIVIAIIGILASLATVGVMKALEKGKMVAARTEISQLEAAIAAAKQKYGLDQLPQSLVLYDNLPQWEAQSGNAAFNSIFDPLKFPSQIRDNSTFTLDQKKLIVADSLNLMKKIFGRDFLKDADLSSNTKRVKWAANAAIDTPVFLISDQAVWFLLGGVLDGYGKFSGFPGYAREPTKTLSAIDATKPILPFLDFDAARMKIGSNGFATYCDPYNTPYAYFSSKYNFCDYSNNITGFGTGYLGKFVYEGQIVRPFFNTYTGGNNPPSNWTQFKFLNPRSFQIISAGPDKVFGTNDTGLPYAPNSGNYIIGAVGYDDLANFSSTQLGKKDE